MELGVIFLTGLTVGGLTCLAVQGGLLASVIAAREKETLEENKKANPIFPVLSFLLAKIFAYTILGFVLGLFGSAISISGTLQTSLQFLAGTYMIIIALNLLDVHPIFRYAVIQPPKFLTRRIRNKSKSADLFAPMVLGLMTIFIPCGTTLAMEALAISSASPLRGALIMFTFVLGTFPMFFGIGFLTSKLGESFKDKFLKVAAFAIILLGLLSIYGSMVAFGVPSYVGRIVSIFTINRPQSENYNSAKLPPVRNGFQEVSINVFSGGYNPSMVYLKNGVPTKLNLKTSNTYSCAIAFRIPALKIGVNLKPTGNEILELPKLDKGDYAFTCSMGMYQGVLKVI